MGTISDKLEYLADTKEAIRQALIDQGQTVDENTPFRNYAIKVGDISGVEDLSTELNAQDQKLEALEQLLLTKSAGSGDGSSMNIFIQDTEPDIKKGIWLETNKEAESITFDEDIFIAGEWEADGTHTNTLISMYQGSAEVIGTNVYLFNGTTVSKYDTLTNTCTKLRDGDTPFSFSYGNSATVTIGTDVYIFGGTRNYKYDTLTDTYTQNTNVPRSGTTPVVVAIGTDIYWWGATSINNSSVCYKYDTLTDTYTQSTANFDALTYGSAVAIGSNIYLFGGYYGTRAYKYDTLTDTVTSLTAPSNFKSAPTVLVSTDIYLFGSTQSGYYQKAYKYDTLTDTYTQLTDIPFAFNYGDAVLVGSKIFLFGGQSYPTKVQVLPLTSKTYQDNSVVIAQGKYASVGYEIELFNNVNIITQPKYAFADAWFYTDNDGIITNIPTYYGNGTSWIKIKN